MAEPGELTPRVITVVDATGGVPALTISDFTVTAYGRGYGAAVWTSYSASPTITEIGGGDYAFDFVLPPSAGWARVRIKCNNPLYTAFNSIWEGEVEPQDLSTLYSSVARPVASLTQGAQLGMPLSLELIAYRFRELVIPVKDEAGNLIATLATDYPSATLRMSVRSQNQVATSWDAGPSATPAGFLITTVTSNLLITIPENAAFFSALAAGTDKADLFWEVTGDLGGDAAKTVPLIRSSPLTLSRREVGSP